MASLRTSVGALLKRSISRQSPRQLSTTCNLSRRSISSSAQSQQASLYKSTFPAPITTQNARIPVRWHSSPASTSKLYDFEQIQSLTSSPHPEQILIDVREPSEYEAGYIPTAINIPVKSQPDALFLTAEEFEDRFGFQKPDPNTEVVFYCRAGVRSNAAAQLAVQNGYTNVSEYRGSWLEWEKKGGKVEKP